MVDLQPKKYENGKEHYIAFAQSPCFLLFLVYVERGTVSSGDGDITDTLRGDLWIEKISLGDKPHDWMANIKLRLY